MATKKTKETTYTQDQVRDLVADIFTELSIKLKDPSIVIASMITMNITYKMFK